MAADASRPAFPAGAGSSTPAMILILLRPFNALRYDAASLQHTLREAEG
jgi:hypothetical protein